MRIALDIDDVLACFMEAYKEKYQTDKFPNRLKSANITRNVYTLRHDRQFWTNLGVKNTLNFIPELYCTKRINEKRFTKEWLRTNNFPTRPVYQMFYQRGNKASMIKGRCDVLVDDSIFNVVKAMQSGLPAILYTTDENKHFDFPYRVSSLDYKEIEKIYKKEISDGIKRNYLEAIA